jgi:hypothetical protein
LGIDQTNLYPYHKSEKCEDCQDGNADTDTPSDGTNKVGIGHKDDAGYDCRPIRTLLAVHEKGKTNQTDEKPPIDKPDRDEKHNAILPDKSKIAQIN